MVTNFAEKLVALIFRAEWEIQFMKTVCNSETIISSSDQFDLLVLLE